MIENSTTGSVVEDGFEAYYAEKLWEMIPPIYRYEDGIAPRPDVLRSMVLILAKQAAILRKSQDMLWDDSFIELCNEWAVPYIGDLLGTRLVSASNARGRRIDVAKTIYYRRRKGTLRVLEELMSDITGWDGKVVEAFKQLARTRHGLDPEPTQFAGAMTHSLPGGWADLRNQQGSERAEGPFDEYAHTPDFRQQKGLSGRHNIPKLAFHLCRLVAYEVEDASPFPKGDGLGFAFDPSGRNIHLFSNRARSDQSNYDWDSWQSAKEWELPLPIRCRLLAHSNFLFSEEVIDALANSPGLSAAEEADLRSLIGYLIEGEPRLKQTLAALPSAASLTVAPLLTSILEESLVSECGKYALYPDSLNVQWNGTAIPRPEMVPGDLSSFDTSNAPSEKTLVLDPERGRLAYTSSGPGLEDLHTVRYHYGFSGPIGAGTYDRRAVEDSIASSSISNGQTILAGDILQNGVTQIEDNKSYFALPDLSNVENLTLQAANQKRPYIRLDQDWVLDTGINTDSFLVLDGLWIGADNDAAIILRGEYECVVIRNCSFDPGGGTDINGLPMATVRLQIEGDVELLVISESILGPIVVSGGGYVEEMKANDSIFQDISGGPAIDLEATAACLDAVTVFGTSNLHTLTANSALFTGICTVTDTQQGCFRYSLAPQGSRVPRAFPHKLLDFSFAAQWFTSQQFGHHGYAQISSAAPMEVQRGAEDGSEIGAFNSLGNPIKLDSLQIKVAEYMPFGLIPMFIFET